MKRCTKINFSSVFSNRCFLRFIFFGKSKMFTFYRFFTETSEVTLPDFLYGRFNFIRRIFAPGTQCIQSFQLVETNFCPNLIGLQSAQVKSRNFLQTSRILLRRKHFFLSCYDFMNVLPHTTPKLRVFTEDFPAGYPPVFFLSSDVFKCSEKLSTAAIL